LGPALGKCNHLKRLKTMGQEPISVILLDPVIDSVASLVRVLEKSKQVDLINVPTAEEALQVAQQFLPCVILVSIRGSLDGASQVELLKKLEKPIRSGQLKALVISSVKNHPLARNIAAIGITDYAEEPIPSKSLLFKTNLIFKAIIALRKLNDSSRAGEQVVFKAGDKKTSDENVTISADVPAKYKPALQFGEDTFVFKGTPPKKIGQKFILEAEGPLPDTGDWVDGPRKEGEEQKWKWVPKLKSDEKEQETGNKDDGWIHDGEKPIFDGGKGKWQLRSKKPRLEFFKDGRSVGSKVETDENGNVVIAEDSQIAKENLMLNKTLAAQAREELVKKIVAFQEKERQEKEAKKLETEAKDKKKSDIKEQENGRPDAYSTKRSEKKKGLQKNVEIGKTGAEEESGDWGTGSDLEGAAEKKINGRRIQEEESDAAVLFDKRKEKKQSELESKVLELRTKEQLLKGLEKDDLSGEQNIRGKMCSDLELKLGKEGLPEGISKEQLESDQNSFQKREGKRIRNLAGRKESSKDWNKADSELAAEDEHKSQGDLETEEDEIERSRSAQAKKKARDRAQKRIAELKIQALEEASRPIKDDMTEEEERALRHELGASDRPELSKRDLSRLARLERAKAHKKEIHDVNESLEGRGVPLEAMFPPDEASEWDQHDSEEIRQKRNFRAIDSVDEDAEDLLGFGKKKKDKKSRKEEAAGEPAVYFLMQSEVQPEDGSWVCVDGHWIYLPKSVFESGFDLLDELLPAWIFEGEDEPELLSEEKKWKFIALAPRRVESPSDLPRAIKDFLKNLRSQAFMALGRSDQGSASAEIDEKVRKEKFDEHQENGVASIDAENDVEDDRNSNRDKGRMQKKRGRGTKIEKEGANLDLKGGAVSSKQAEDVADGESREIRKKRTLESKSIRDQERDGLNGEEFDELSRSSSSGKGGKKDFGEVFIEDAIGKEENLGTATLEEGYDNSLGEVSQDNSMEENGFGKVELEESGEEGLGKVDWEKGNEKRARKKHAEGRKVEKALSDLASTLKVDEDLYAEKNGNAANRTREQDNPNGEGFAGSESNGESDLFDPGSEDLEDSAGDQQGRSNARGKKNRRKKSEDDVESKGGRIDLADESQKNKFASEIETEHSNEEKPGEDTWIAKQRPELSLFGHELLVLVAINDTRRRQCRLDERIPLFLKMIGTALPGFQCMLEVRKNGKIAVEITDVDSLAENRIPVRIDSSLDSQEIGTLVVIPPDGRGKLSKRETLVFDQFAAALAQLLEESAAQRESKVA